MSGGSAYLDILIFAIIAIFLGLRLRSALGKKTGFEQNLPRDAEVVEKIIGGKQESAAAELAEQVSGKGITALRRADSNFNEKEFVKGGSAAYQMILTSFAEGDVDALKPLLGYEMNASFSEAIRQREKLGETLSIDIKSLDNAEITAVVLTDGLAAVTMEFKSTQQRKLIAENGAIIDGDGEDVKTFIDRWIFERDISSTDPNWLLVETESLDA